MLIGFMKRPPLSAAPNLSHSLLPDWTSEISARCLLTDRGSRALTCNGQKRNQKGIGKNFINEVGFLCSISSQTGEDLVGLGHRVFGGSLFSSSPPYLPRHSSPSPLHTSPPNTSVFRDMKTLQSPPIRYTIWTLSKRLDCAWHRTCSPHEIWGYRLEVVPPCLITSLSLLRLLNICHIWPAYSINGISHSPESEFQPTIYFSLHFLLQAFHTSAICHGSLLNLIKEKEGMSDVQPSPGASGFTSSSKPNINGVFSRPKHTLSLTGTSPCLTHYGTGIICHHAHSVNWILIALAW